MANNQVVVGSGNSGNVSGGDLIVNHSLPCKNGDAMLAYEDYQRMPYCNRCIENSRIYTQRVYHQISVACCILLNIIVIGGYWLIFDKLPNFRLLFLENNPFTRQLSPLFSSAIAVSLIFVVGTTIASMAAFRYNEKYFQYHK